VTGTTAGARREPLPGDLAARLFRALYPQFELRSFSGLHIAVPKDTRWYAGRSLTDLACQISAVPSYGPDNDRPAQPGSGLARRRR
jgi:hypothetical protein